MGISRDRTDPDQSGYSLANLADLIIRCLEAVAPASVVEVGAFQGDLTRELLDWAATSGTSTSIAAIDPVPPDDLLKLAAQRPELELIRETSHEALAVMPVPDAIILDGDHNYYTLSEELRLIGERAPGSRLPLLILHDVGWPHARRDTYYEPDRIPAEHRQPLAHQAALSPGEPGLAASGLPFEWVARREGGARNGVLTAIEDFVRGREGLRLATVPAFFGMGVLWHRDAPWADAVAEVIEPFDRNPLLERLEANRVGHLAVRYGQARELKELRRRDALSQEVLRGLIASKAFALAGRLSRLRQPSSAISWRDQVKRALGEQSGQAKPRGDNGLRS
jgi:hypothetical protein